MPARKIIFIILAIIVIAPLAFSNAQGDPAAGPNLSTQRVLNSWYLALESFKNSSGRYPLSLKELKALEAKTNGPQCQKLPETCLYNLTYSDGWKKPVKYSSNGKTYRVTTSKEYFLTEKSPEQKNGLHWENSNPPPDDPPAHTRPGTI